MNEVKAQASLVASQRPGRELDADFCRWHARLVDAQLVASCTLENCPLQQAQADRGRVDDPARIFLAHGVALADLKKAFGKDDWPLFKDNLPALHSALDRLVSQNSAGVQPQMGTGQHRGFLTNEEGTDSFLVPISNFLINILAKSLDWVGPSEQGTREGLNSLLSEIAPSNLEQGQLLCDFLASHLQGFKLFIDEAIVFPEDGVYIFKLSDTHDDGLKLLDHSLIHLHQLAQLVCSEPLRLDLDQRRLQQNRLLMRKQASVACGFQEALAVSDESAVELMLHPFLEALTCLGLTQNEETLKQIYSLLYASPSLEPIEALVKLQRLLLRLIVHRLNDQQFYLGERADRHRLLLTYHQAISRRDKALENWYACRDGAVGPHPT